MAKAEKHLDFSASQRSTIISEVSRLESVNSFTIGGMEILLRGEKTGREVVEAKPL